MIYVEDYGIPIPEFLKEYNYVIPKFCVYKDDHINIYLEYGDFKLYLKSYLAMGYKINHTTAAMFIPHYEMAYGHVISTGLGLGVLATWLAVKPEVTKITIIENDLHLINYFKTYGDLPDKVELIHGDGETYTGKCDVLFPDHMTNVYSKNKRLVTWPNILDRIECDLVYTWRIAKNVKSYEKYLDMRIDIPKLPYITEEKYKIYCNSMVIAESNY